jgi:uncharacterized protein (DUF362 family)
VLVMGADVVAVDATCCRLMGIDPERVGYLREAEELGNLGAAAIEQRGEAPGGMRQKFRLISEISHLQEA